MQGQSRRETRVRELRRPVIVVHEINPARRSVTHFPAGGQSAGHGKIAEVSWDSRIVPRTDAGRHVIKVNLTLAGFTHFVAIRQIVGQGPSRLLLLLG